MRFLVSITTFYLVLMTSAVQAGTLSNGEWTVSTCGEKPTLPVIEERDVEAFNKSIKAINDWQQLSKTYYACIVSDANKDNAIIAEKANKEQANYKQDFETISSAVEKAKKKLDKK